MTLAPWGESNNTPLRVSVQDSQYNSVFSIAVLRGHRDLARALVEICFAQFQPSEEEPLKSRYRISEENEDDESVSSDVAVYKELIDDRFTIDNIGELSTQVKSDVSPLRFIALQVPAWVYTKYCFPEKRIVYGIDNREVDIAARGNTCDLGTWSLITNDKSLFTFLLDLEVDWADRLATQLDGSSGMPSFSGFEFQVAIEYGRIELLAEMIKHTGAGLELESLVKQSDVKYREKPKYYQGLSVHGKKRPGWINAARGTYSQTVSDNDVPVLSAAFKGSLQCVEWFLSDAPARHYLDFAEAYKHNKYIEHINKKSGGFEKLLKKWLGARRKTYPFKVFKDCVLTIPRQPSSTHGRDGRAELRVIQAHQIPHRSEPRSPGGEVDRRSHATHSCVLASPICSCPDSHRRWCRSNRPSL